MKHFPMINPLCGDDQDIDHQSKLLVRTKFNLTTDTTANWACYTDGEPTGKRQETTAKQMLGLSAETWLSNFCDS